MPTFRVVIKKEEYLDKHHSSKKEKVGNVLGETALGISIHCGVVVIEREREREHIICW